MSSKKQLESEQFEMWEFREETRNHRDDAGRNGPVTQKTLENGGRYVEKGLEGRKGGRGAKEDSRRGRPASRFRNWTTSGQL